VSQTPQIDLEYWLSIGFLWSRIMRLRTGCQAKIGPQLQLALLRQITDFAAGIDYAVNGDIPELKDLFARGMASPRDVSTIRGYTLLRWAIYAK
jgi:hypothetical protein